MSAPDTQDAERTSKSVATAHEGHNDRGLTSGLRVVVILGATATGKSGLALKAAERFGGEVVSTDSRYLYRSMDVGTAKPSSSELASVPHHLINVVEPDEDYSLATFLDDAFQAIETASAREHLPVVAGGTPLYLRALLEGWRVPRVAPNEALRAELDGVAANELYGRLQAVDPPSAERIGSTNKRRLIRALEVYQVSGRPMSELEGKQPPPYSFLILGLRMDRDALYRRIDERVRSMFANGLIDEARRLIEREIPPEAPAMSAIGYREARLAVLGEIDLETAIERTCFATHRYVRHQETWFRRFENVHWLDSANPVFVDEALARVEAFLSYLVKGHRHA